MGTVQVSPTGEEKPGGSCSEHRGSCGILSVPTWATLLWLGGSRGRSHFPGQGTYGHFWDFLPKGSCSRTGETLFRSQLCCLLDSNPISTLHLSF